MLWLIENGYFFIKFYLVGSLIFYDHSLHDIYINKCFAHYALEFYTLDYKQRFIWIKMFMNMQKMVLWMNNCCNEIYDMFEHLIGVCVGWIHFVLLIHTCIGNSDVFWFCMIYNFVPNCLGSGYNMICTMSFTFK